MVLNTKKKNPAVCENDERHLTTLAAWLESDAANALEATTRVWLAKSIEQSITTNRRRLTWAKKSESRKEGEA